jgi:peptidyl-prolyl cis-trans isomerase C
MRPRRRSRWLREPLVHFVALGAVVFALHHWVAPPPLTRRIVLSEPVIRGLRQDYFRRNGTLPSPEEETALIQRFIDDEVQYREALALGLDRGDIIVRRRLVQKMEFLTEDVEPLPDPTDDELQTYLEAHAERYVQPERWALTHVFVSNDRHGGEAPALAARLHDQLIAGADPAGLGDPFLRGQQIPPSTEPELAAIFGATFAARAVSLTPGLWSDPVRSSYGLHLVRLTQHAASRLPTLSEIRAAVRRDWQEERRAATNRAALDRLRQQYDIRIEGPTVADARSK